MKTIIISIVTAIIIVCSSCSNSKFLNRKYTSGIFLEKTHSLRHNTIHVDTSVNYCANNKNEILFSRKSTVELITDKMIAPQKKDSIFIKQKTGKDQITVRKNNQPDILIITNKKNQVIYKPLKNKKKYEKKIKNKPDASVQVLSILALCFSLIPLVGLIFCATVKSYLRKYESINPDKPIGHYKVMVNIASGLSIASLIIALVILFCLLVYGLFFGAFSFFAAILI